jgi:hypothetical protein
MSAVDIGANHDSDQVIDLKQRLTNKGACDIITVHR